MEVEIYKLTYTKKINKKLEEKIKYWETLLEEIHSDNIRILGNYFMNNNKNRAKLLINNKKYNLKEFVNKKECTEDKFKIKIVLSKEISNISHMFEDCAI